MYFEGDIVITDPCYLVKKRSDDGMPKWDDYMRYKSAYEYPDYDALQGGLSPMFREDYTKMDKASQKWIEENPDDWEICDYGEDMSQLGFKSCMTTSTNCGDWSCRTIEKGTKNILGTFCADAGMVGIFLLNEVLAYNPDFKLKMTSSPHCMTIIKDFKGNIEFQLKGKADPSTKIVGTGNVNFSTR